MTYTVCFSFLTSLNALISDFSSLDPYMFEPIKAEFLYSKPEAEHVTKCIMKAVSNIADPCIYESGISYMGRKCMMMLIIRCIFILIEIQNVHDYIYIISIFWLISDFNAVYFGGLEISFYIM